MTPKTSLGFDVILFSEDVCGVDLFPWQKWLLVHALELLPDGSFRFRNVVVLVARQNGKSTLSQIVALWFMYRYGADLVLGTAQDLDTAEEVWQGAVDLVDDVPELKELRSKVVLNNGKKSLELKTGERYKVKAANRRAGRGLSGDLILLDELREHQSWDAWAAVTKTTMAREHAQVWSLSNAGDATSVVLRYLRKMAHAALGDPDGINAADDPSSLLPGDEVDEDVEIEDEDSLGIFEWSARPDRSTADRDGWAEANPSLGYSITERTIGSAVKTDPEWIVRTEVLCQWSSGALEGPFPPGAWEAGWDKRPEPARSSIAEADRIGVGVDVSTDRSMTHIAFAGLNQYGRLHVEVVASRAGVEWVEAWLTSADRVSRPRWVGVAGQGKGAPVSGLLDDLADVDGLTVAPWQGSDLAAGTGRFYDAVRNNELAHLEQPVLDVAAATAVTKPLGEAWVWNRRQSPTDIGPLVAATAAVWVLTNAPVQTVSAYETAGLLIA